MYREDYARAGFEMISKATHTGARSASQSVLFCILLLFICGVPGVPQDRQLQLSDRGARVERPLHLRRDAISPDPASGRMLAGFS